MSALQDQPVRHQPSLVQPVQRDQPVQTVRLVLILRQPVQQATLVRPVLRDQLARPVQQVRPRLLPARLGQLVKPVQPVLRDRLARRPPFLVQSAI